MSAIQGFLKVYGETIGTFRIPLYCGCPPLRGVRLSGVPLYNLQVISVAYSLHTSQQHYTTDYIQSTPMRDSSLSLCLAIYLHAVDYILALTPVQRPVLYGHCSVSKTTPAGQTSQ